MSLPKAPQPHTNFIRVRPYKNSDGDAPARIFREGMIVGATSSLEAVLRGSLTGRHSILTYFVFLSGVFTALWSPACHARMGGIALACVSVIYFVVHRLTLKKILMKHGTHEHADLKLISKHYKITPKSDATPVLLGPDGFWVAEVVEDGCTEGEVVGCVGLDTSVARAPGCAELRRMAVSANLQRRGIGRMLLEAALAHARTHGIATIWLSTSAHQKSAVGIYEKFGWKRIGPTILKMAPFWVDARIMDWKLDLVSEDREMANKDWEKMA